MHPVLIDTGSFQLHTYGALAALGFLVVVFFALRAANDKGWERERIIDVIFYSALAAIVGARAFFFLQNPETIANAWSLVDMRQGGMVFYGAPLLGIPVGVALLHRYGLPVWDVADSFARTLPLAHGMSRVGCFAAGCCYGAASDVSWAVSYDHPLSAAPHGIAMHPVQLYEATGLFLLSAVLFALEQRKRFYGQVLVAYLGSYALLRLGIELFRGDPERRFVLPQLFGELISTSQGVSLALLMVVLGLLLVRRGDRVTA